MVNEEDGQGREQRDRQWETVADTEGEDGSGMTLSSGEKSDTKWPDQILLVSLKPAVANLLELTDHRLATAGSEDSCLKKLLGGNS